ncbi:hypothetical protein V5O48_013225 [Marasmius crinis-equi]|uniref:Fungal-type protein kinase domain-containing protein n=1 Tax=Marasmius crinis-equi TaxID=585013 RepID=A0ABR3F0P2_9AGAR
MPCENSKIISTPGSRSPPVPRRSTRVRRPPEAIYSSTATDRSNSSLGTRPTKTRSEPANCARPTKRRKRGDSEESKEESSDDAAVVAQLSRPKTSPPGTPGTSVKCPQLDNSVQRHRTQTEGSDYRSRKVDDALFINHSSTPMTSLEQMMKAYFSCKDQLHIDELCELLESDLEVIANGRWSSALVLPSPSKASGEEAEVFGFMQRLGTRIMDAFDQLRASHPSLPHRTNEMRINDDSYPMDAMRYRSTKPDGWSEFRESSREPAERGLDWTWLTTAWLMEFTKPEPDSDEDEEDRLVNDLLDNRQNAVWLMHQVMHHDPRRRFIFALTVENTTVRLWFLNRATLVVSHAFDLHEDWKTLVHVLVALQTADRTRLGYDETISLHSHFHGGKAAYNTTVHDTDRNSQLTGTITMYRTLACISDYSADVLTSHPATRVWRVKKVVARNRMVGSERVLKDAWINHDRPPEHIALNEIRERLRETGDPLPVSTANPNKTDHTLKIHRHGVEFDCKDVLPLTKNGLEDTEDIIQDEKAASHPAENASSQCLAVNRDQRIHYRIVFEEVGQPLRALNTFDKLFFGLQGGICGCGAMHDVGFIHRDISVNNILVIERKISTTTCKCAATPPADIAPGKELVPIIIDLEHAVKIDRVPKGRDTRVGTWHFMASEVQRQIWISIFRPADIANEPFALRETPWRQHALHDIESFLWVAVWIIFRFLIPRHDQRTLYRDKYHSLFPSGGLKHILETEILDDAIYHGLPIPYRDFGEALLSWVRSILDCFRLAFRHAYPELQPVKFSQKSPEAVQKSIGYLEELRKAARDSKVLRGEVEHI